MFIFETIKSGIHVLKLKLIIFWKQKYEQTLFDVVFLRQYHSLSERKERINSFLLKKCYSFVTPVTLPGAVVTLGVVIGERMNMPNVPKYVTRTLAVIPRSSHVFRNH